MSAEAEFRGALVAHAPLFAVVGQRIALNAVQAETPTPYLAFTARHDPQYTLDNTLAADFVTIEVQCWAATAVDASTVGDLVEAAVRAAGAIVVARSSAFDADVGLDAELITVEWID